MNNIPENPFAASVAVGHVMAEPPAFAGVVDPADVAAPIEPVAPVEPEAAPPVHEEVPVAPAAPQAEVMEPVAPALSTQSQQAQPQEEVDDFAVPGFIAVLKVLGGARLLDQIDDQLKEVLKALDDKTKDEGGKASGAVSVSLKFEMKDGAVHLVGKSEVKLPPPPAVSGTFFVNNSGHLTGANPLQRQIPFSPQAVTVY